MRITWLPLAVERASEIADYIAQDKPAAAEKWVNMVFSKVEQLKSSPEIGRIEKNQISILTIRHGKQLLSINEIMA